MSSKVLFGSYVALGLIFIGAIIPADQQAPVAPAVDTTAQVQMEALHVMAVQQCSHGEQTQACDKINDAMSELHIASGVEIPATTPNALASNPRAACIKAKVGDSSNLDEITAAANECAA